VRAVIRYGWKYEPRRLPPGARGLHDLRALVQGLMRRARRERQPYARVRRALLAVAPDLTDCPVLGFHEGTLELGVPDAVLRAELQSFRAEELVTALQATHAGLDVSSIRFRLLPPEVSDG